MSVSLLSIYMPANLFYFSPAEYKDAIFIIPFFCIVWSTCVSRTDVYKEYSLLFERRHERRTYTRVLYMQYKLYEYIDFT